MSDDIPEWTEGVCGDGAAILRDGEMVPIEDVVAALNRAEAVRSAALEEAAQVADIEAATDKYATDSQAHRIAAAIRALKGEK